MDNYVCELCCLVFWVKKIVKIIPECRGDLTFLIYTPTLCYSLPEIV